MRVILVGLILSASASAGETGDAVATPAVAAAGVVDAVGGGVVGEPDVYDCDGQDEFLLREIDEAFKSGIGLGETWDETVCEEGLLSVYAEGANRRWPDLRRRPLPPKKPKAPDKTPEELKADNQFFALAMPIFAVGACGFTLAMAALIGVFLRLRKQIVLDVACPTCKTPVPFIVGERPHLFCPRCGGACRVDVTGVGKATTATAIPL